MLKNGLFTVMWSEKVTEENENQSALKESDAVYLLGLERHCVFWASFTKPDIEFREVLLSNGPIEGSNQ